MSNVRPFLSTIASVEPAQAAPRAFASVIGTVPTTPAAAPWLPGGPPKPAPVAAPVAPPEIDTSEIEAEAREQGRAEGLAETEELRAQLAQAIAMFQQARTALIEPTATKIAAAAVAVVAAWTETAPAAELYAPIIRAWLAKHEAPATAYVAPAHVAAVKEVVAGTPISVVADAAMRAGDMRLSSPTMELAHAWDSRMGDLRDAVAAALEQS